MNSDDVVSLSIGAVGLLIGIAGILISIFADAVRDFLVNRLGYILGKGRISGIWDATYCLPGPDDGNNEEITEQLIVKQIGNKMIARLRSGNHQLRAKGNIRSTHYVSGVWYHPHRHSVYHGAFHVVIDPEGNEIEGRWIGYGWGGKPVQTGEWVWKRRPDLEEDSPPRLVWLKRFLVALLEKIVGAGGAWAFS
jgi:hypothetical protein